MKLPPAPLLITALLGLVSVATAQERYVVPPGIKAMEIDGKKYRVPEGAAKYDLATKFFIPGTSTVVPGVDYTRLKGQATFRGQKVPANATHAYSQVRFYYSLKNKPGVADVLNGDGAAGTHEMAVPVPPDAPPMDVPEAPSAPPGGSTPPSEPPSTPPSTPPSSPPGSQPTPPTMPSQPPATPPSQPPVTPPTQPVTPPTQPPVVTPTQPTRPTQPTQPTQPPANQPVDFKKGACYVQAGNAAGSGTIIGSYKTSDGRYANIIITAGHTFDGYGNSAINVKDRDLNPIGRAQMIRYSYERRNPNEHDLALIVVYTNQQMPITKVAQTPPQVGDPVAVVGKSYRESEITVHRTTTDRDNYWGQRPRTSTKFIPVSGHSGGGLLNARGELVGVVSGGNGTVGLHSPLIGVHAWLDKANLSQLYR